MGSPRRFTRYARSWHLITAAVTAFALIFQLSLVVSGASVLVATSPPSLPERLVRFISYFTILSNILVLYTEITLVRNPLRGGRIWRVLRLNAIVGIAVTGVIHWFFLRPLLNLHGAPYAADKLLHVAIPLLAVIGWIAFGPRNRINRPDLLPSLVYPVAWVLYTLARGALSRWYPYPFLDVGKHGYGAVVVNCLGIAILLLGLSVVAMYVDRRLPPDRSARNQPTRAATPP